MIHDVGKKTKEELIEEFSRITSHNTLDGEQYTAAIMVKSAADIQLSTNEIRQSVDNFRKSAENIGKSSDQLSRKLLWLNIILTAATVVGAVATAVVVFKNK